MSLSTSPKGPGQRQKERPSQKGTLPESRSRLEGLGAACKELRRSAERWARAELDTWEDDLKGRIDQTLLKRPLRRVAGFFAIGVAALSFWLALILGVGALLGNRFEVAAAGVGVLALVGARLLLGAEKK